MPTSRVSLRLDEGLVAEARKLTGPSGLSSYVNRALGRQLQKGRMVGFLKELEEEAGPIDADILEEIRHAWPPPNKGTAKDS